MSGKCRFCDSVLNIIFIDLGQTPLANSFLKKSEFEKEKSYPLCAYICENCLLVQLEEVESPKKIFSEYAYFSSYSESWLNHAKKYVEMILSRFSINNSSLVIEIASNDGYLLQYFKDEKIPILGVEPASNIAKVAIEKGIPTLTKFFGVDTASELLQEGKLADLIVGNNVLAHVPNLNNFIEGLKIILKPNGVITLEFPHILKLIKYNQFDTIYHEHYSYFSLITLKKIFLFHNLKIFDVEELTTHGGSLRIFLTHLKNDSVVISKKIDDVLEKEKELGLNNISGYMQFSKNVEKIKVQLLNFLNEAKKSSKTVVGYGAAAKGNTLLNYCGIEKSLIDYVVDRSSHKHGLYLPGTHIPIFDTKKITETNPDYMLILPWNLKDEIMSQIIEMYNWQGKFVVPIPGVEIFS